MSQSHRPKCVRIRSFEPARLATCPPDRNRTGSRCRTRSPRHTTWLPSATARSRRGLERQQGSTAAPRRRSQ
ncbi:hypothetical protein BCR34DRAFT_554041 [Clohesyomyces aquaticus]|uniref:Uncharacterized protein n=1 Tax=Clohesyomyces aquaticus TaxID=1231657 RepID=A0A1Y2A756_9PLEO|nr:hypothetical protein BCR34DRAFT_554041 [Clohesyomyces aquaticus]